jgi:hypothetical protein
LSVSFANTYLKYELTAQRYEESLKPPNDLKKKETPGNLTYPKLPYYSTRVSADP